MLYLQVIFLLILSLAYGGNCIEVKTSIGGDAVLPCGLEPLIDANCTAVEWSRPDLPPDQYVYFQRDCKEFTDAKYSSYKGRTSLCKGNVFLKISTVTPSDAGTYTCFIPETEKSFVELIVEAIPESSEGKPELSPGGQFPWWGGLLIALIIIIIIIIIIGGGRVWFGHRNFSELGKPAHYEDGSIDLYVDNQGLEDNGISTDSTPLK